MQIDLGSKELDASVRPFDGGKVALVFQMKESTDMELAVFMPLHTARELAQRFRELGI